MLFPIFIYSTCFLPPGKKVLKDIYFFIYTPRWHSENLWLHQSTLNINHSSILEGCCCLRSSLQQPILKSQNNKISWFKCTVCNIFKIYISKCFLQTKKIIGIMHQMCPRDYKIINSLYMEKIKTCGWSTEMSL